MDTVVLPPLAISGVQTSKPLPSPPPPHTHTHTIPNTHMSPLEDYVQGLVVFHLWCGRLVSSLSSDHRLSMGTRRCVHTYARCAMRSLGMWLQQRGTPKTQGQQEPSRSATTPWQVQRSSSHHYLAGGVGNGDGRRMPRQLDHLQSCWFPWSQKQNGQKENSACDREWVHWRARRQERGSQYWSTSGPQYTGTPTPAPARRLRTPTPILPSTPLSTPILGTPVVL